MTFKVNDSVCVLDDDLSGRVIKINKNQITIETTLGFELTFLSSELVKVQDNFLKTITFSGNSIEKVISEKSNQKQKLSKRRIKTGAQPPMEVDLHIEKLVTSKNRMEKSDMLNFQLDTAKRRLEFAFSKRIQRVIFIHGVGEGILKLELEYLLKRYDNLKFYPANFQQYGHGATEVYIFQNKSS